MNAQQTSKASITISRISGIISSILGYAFAILFGLPLIMGAFKFKRPGELILVLIFLALAALLITYGIRTKRRINRFKRYVGIISIENQPYLENIAGACSQSVDFVAKDLQKMIDKKFFINAYIDKNTNEIVLERKNTTTTNEAINNNKAVEFKAVTCKCCGASNKIPAGLVAECEFCGSAINPQ